ncbi:nickel pincer cofactor biosynthesis protein LarB [Streptomyces sp. LB8]|uniref:nickel pincer cofactor biosynthesis protein LarB n=1 Tax=Streptomyces sp. LB8 TaxID=3042509 RepID=UPI0024820972|nr:MULTISPECIES: nickel pincer cofactor biosynthesis protein LarB [Streptomyces]MDN5383859.1 nickel pincer cofactor biosynthesis protein LarB [Streptomyces sp. LB8]
MHIESIARLDSDRRRRTGVPEVVFAEGKTPEQTLRLLAGLRRADPAGPALATRCPSEVLSRAPEFFAGEDGPVAVDRLGRTVVVGELPVPCGEVAVLTAGTSDLAVAHECLTTLGVLGVRGRLVGDVGVAGLHRLLDALPDLEGAACAVVIAGMEGALPSVVAGLVDMPVVAVPSPVGYGIGAGGLAAAAAMLSSCSPGVAVMNIGNGFGAAVHAARIARRSAAAATGTDRAAGVPEADGAPETPRPVGLASSTREDPRD